MRTLVEIQDRLKELHQEILSAERYMETLRRRGLDGSPGAPDRREKYRRASNNLAKLEAGRDALSWVLGLRGQ